MNMLIEPLSEPILRRWTREEFYRMADLGLFQGQRAELIEGVIMVLSPQKWPHAAATDRTTEVLRNLFGAGYWVRMQLPLNLSSHSDPEPDVSVVVGQRGDYQDHPTNALLVVEISDTTLKYDRTEKAGLYASSGIADYWIVNLVDQQVEVHREPVPDSTQILGWRYGSVTVYHRGMAIIPLTLPNASVLVTSLLE